MKITKLGILGRVALPVDMRRQLGIAIRDDIEILVDGDRIALMKRFPTCELCGSMERLSRVKDGHICAGCAEEIRKQAYG